MECSEVDETSRDIINAASGEFFSEHRKLALLEVVRRTTAPTGADVEAKAVALAMLAQQDPSYLEEAISALEQATAANAQRNWALMHLAEAFFKDSRLTEALKLASSVDQEFFDEQDLRWRSVRMDEIRAVTLLRLGDYSQGTSLAIQLCNILSLQGDDEDLASPADLANEALSLTTSPDKDARSAGCTILTHLTTSIEIDSWFTAEVAGRVRASMANCDDETA
ncbi:MULTISPECIES: hypothetical protein [unclassified Pseudofrankia]|uniref:hypothetical protein n=1 Tax=unclassified Pseudofrankia TaxID=2994372 RepID=UPI001041E516|nr:MULTISPECIES: hypothetical protein [unclassified Pseudofrankia]MDT3446383.1 hypothetical protein [Pseudofrankia sp. BMG5.37]